MEKDFQRDNPENWKWGIFYVNKKDSRFIVRKKEESLGWTFNFAHPVSIVVLILILALPLVSIILNW